MPIVADHAVLLRSLRPWVGTWPTLDRAILGMVDHMLPKTGAGLFSADMAKVIQELIDAGTPTPVLCRRIVMMCRRQITAEGAVLAPMPSPVQRFLGAKLEPWHSYGFMMQGHAAAMAFFCWHSMEREHAKLGDLIADWIASRQGTQTALASARGLWCHGDQYAVAPDVKGRMTSAWAAWSEWWAYVGGTWALEDQTSVANTCCMLAAGKSTEYERAVDGLAVMLTIGDGLAPYNCSRRSLQPEWSRNCSGPFLSTETSAGAAMVIEASPWAARHAAITRRTRQRLKALEANGRWPMFLDPQTWCTVYPMADPADPTRARPNGNGVATFDRACAVKNFDQDTNFPARLIYGPN